MPTWKHVTFAVPAGSAEQAKAIVKTAFMDNVVDEDIDSLFEENRQEGDVSTDRKETYEVECDGDPEVADIILNASGERVDEED